MGGQSCRSVWSAPRTIFVACAVMMLASTAWAEPCRVTLRQDGNAGWTLLRDGHPFRIRGAGGEGSLETLRDCGGTMIRTWGIEATERRIDGVPFLDRAHQLGLSVTLGLWLGHERHGFDYGDERQIAAQREMVERAVRTFQHHPAVVIWGLGNEMEGRGDNPTIWREVNWLARRIKDLDPNHPVMTVVANFDAAKLAAIEAHAPDIDILGVNAYGGIETVPDRLRQAGWTRPYCITEFGLNGPWEVGLTPWKAPIEPSSASKAASTAQAQDLISEDARCLGSYAFLWGQKQEATSSWFGMFLPTGERTARVDVMQKSWSGQWPANRAPVLGQADVPFAEREVRQGEPLVAGIRHVDPDGDPLSYAFEVVRESTDRREGGDAEQKPEAVRDAVVHCRPDEGVVEIRAPSEPGAYRLFVTVRDGHGGGAVDNWPFFVRADR